MGMLCFTHSVIRQARGAGLCMRTAADQSCTGWSAGSDVHGMRVHESCAADMAGGGRSGLPLLAACASYLMGLRPCPAAAGTSSSCSPGCPRCWPPWASRTCPPSACSAPCPGWCAAAGGCCCHCWHAPAFALCCMGTLRAHVCWLALLKTWSSVKDALACACPMSMQATAIVSVAAGGLADRLQAVHGWSAVRVRRAMQMSATLGTGLRWGSESWLGCSGVCQGGVERVDRCSTAAVGQGGTTGWQKQVRLKSKFAAAPAPPAPLLQPAATSVAGSCAGACFGSGRAGGCGGLARVHICWWALLKLGMGSIAMPPICFATRHAGSATPSSTQSPLGAPWPPAPCRLPLVCPGCGSRQRGPGAGGD